MPRQRSRSRRRCSRAALLAWSGVPGGAQQAKNGFGEAKYSGPCPPKGDAPHRYVFSIYALSAPIDGANGADAGQVRDDIRDKALASGRLTGLYGR